MSNTFWSTLVLLGELMGDFAKGLNSLTISPSRNSMSEPNMMVNRATKELKRLKGLSEQPPLPSST